MNRFEAFVTLNLVREIGSTRLKKLLEVFCEPENILKVSAQKLTAVSGIGEKIAQKITSLKKEDLERELSLAKKFNLKIITLEDKDYPENLKFIPV
jgi:predicted Rossmann fold nucleotide-binding protein DprA/Smf involved in DNA uptake